MNLARTLLIGALLLPLRIVINIAAAVMTLASIIALIVLTVGVDR